MPTSLRREDLLTNQVVDYDSHDSLVSGLRGQDFLIISLSVFAPQDTQSKLIAAAKDTGVQWIMPNEYGNALSDREDVGRDVKLGPPAWAARQQILDAGMSFVALSCGFWYEYSVAGGEERYGFDLAKRSVTLFDAGETKITTSTWPQCGRAVAAFLALPVLPQDENDPSPTISDRRNNSVYVGSFFVSQKDIFASVLRATGTAESDWTVKHEDVKARYERGSAEWANGDFKGFATLLFSRLFYPDGSGDLQNRLWNNVLALPEEDLDEATKVAVEMAKT